MFFLTSCLLSIVGKQMYTHLVTCSETKKKIVNGITDYIFAQNGIFCKMYT